MCSAQKGSENLSYVASTPAVVNAVHDALLSFGIRHIDMPLTPMKIWQAIHTSAQQPELHAYSAKLGAQLIMATLLIARPSPCRSAVSTPCDRSTLLSNPEGSWASSAPTAPAKPRSSTL